MAINTQELFRQKQVQFGAGSSPARFTADFITATNRSLRDLATRAKLPAKSIATVADNIDLNAKYEPYVSSVLDFHLLMLGHNPGFEVSLANGVKEIAIRDAQLLNFQEDLTVVAKLDLDS